MHKFSFWDYDMAGRSRSRLAFFLCLLFLLPHCGDPTASPPEQERDTFYSFYYWQTAFSLSRPERAWLDSLEVDRLYLKFFDLDWDPAAAEVIPLASVELDTNGLDGRLIIPTIFITNRSLLNLPPEGVPLLAARMVEKLDRHFAGLRQPLREIQLDCDWTAGSRERYFALIQALREQYRGRNVVLSATIRLHQVRYPEQTGVPPVDRGVLMFYNMGDLSDWSEPNSILNLEKAAAYLPVGLQYSLPLDVALPLFRWAVLFREGDMIRLINEPTDSLLRDTQKFLPLAPDRFQVVESTYLDGYYLYRGDHLRLEQVRPEQLRAAYQLLHRQLPEAVNGLIFYHLDRPVIGRYQLSDLKLR